MTRISRDGWVVEGDTLDELTIGIEAVQRALAKASVPAAQRLRGRPRKPPERAEQQEDEKAAAQKARAVSFLKAIAAGGLEGTSAPDMIRVLKLESGKALGGITAAANRVLKQAEHEPNSVYLTVDRPGQSKRWVRRPKLDDVISELEIGF